MPSLTAAGKALLGFMSKPATQVGLTALSFAPSAIGALEQFGRDTGDPVANTAGGLGALGGGLTTGAIAATMAPKGWRRAAGFAGSIPGVFLGGNVRGLFDDPVAQQIRATERLAQSAANRELANFNTMAPARDEMQRRMLQQMQVQAQLAAVDRYQQAMLGAVLNPPQVRLDPGFSQALGQIGAAALG